MIDRKVLAKTKGGGGQRGWEEQPSKGTQQDICKSKTKQNITKKQTNKKKPQLFESTEGGQVAGVGRATMLNA